MPLTRYRYSQAATGLFEMPTENARALLASQLEPVEVHHGVSIFSATVFDFVESEVGPYRELVLSVVVTPLVEAGEPLPKVAFYPYMIGTTTAAARAHAIERWHLPHWMEDVQIGIDARPGRLVVHAAAREAPLLELSVTDHGWQPARHLYQSFMRDARGSYVAHIVMEGAHSEHQEETGSLRLFDHPFHGALSLPEVAEAPFQEVWYKDGVQTFESMRQLQIA